MLQVIFNPEKFFSGTRYKDSKKIAWHVVDIL